mmetsp:Transcript_31557/g.70915  ORF Transcript_31557/g.70915 Transcript_31557/m.70915 type:complete len:212 (+) Transcript_31557:1179-1814(+)
MITVWAAALSPPRVDAVMDALLCTSSFMVQQKTKGPNAKKAPSPESAEWIEFGPFALAAVLGRRLGSPDALALRALPTHPREEAGGKAGGLEERRFKKRGLAGRLRPGRRRSGRSFLWRRAWRRRAAAAYCERAVAHAAPTTPWVGTRMKSPTRLRPAARAMLMTGHLVSLAARQAAWAVAATTAAGTPQRPRRRRAHPCRRSLRATSSSP